MASPSSPSAGRPEGRLIAGVVGQDVRRQGAFGFGAFFSRKIVASGAVSLATGTQGFEPGVEVSGADRDHRLGHLATDLIPAGVFGVVASQGAGRREEAGFLRLRLVQRGPELRGQLTLYGSKACRTTGSSGSAASRSVESGTWEESTGRRARLAWSRSCFPVRLENRSRAGSVQR